MSPRQLFDRLNYRADIDGLRGIAVLATVGYHAFPNWFRGGFTGVDIFFVISGYLISGDILKSLQTGDLNIASFYARRVKRIFPAVLVVLLCLIVIGWFALFADEYKQLGKHVAGTTAFLSNMILWKEIGYFDNAAHTKPLLHGWSLAVEEQFYLIWPIALWWTGKVRLNAGFFIAGAAILSFWCGIWLMQNGERSAFYLPHARFWELALGSLLAYHATHNHLLTTPKFGIKAVSGNFLSSILSGLGLILIFCGVSMFSLEQSYPSWRALVPTTGALLIIVAGPLAWLNRAVLSHRILVTLGLISFPLYLWHWPLLSLMHIIRSEGPGLDVTLPLIALSVVLAWLTYRWVEVPLRFGYAGRLKVPLLVGAMVAVGGLGWLTFIFDGFPQRLPNASAATVRMNDWDYPSQEMKSDSFEGVPLQKVGGQGKQTLFFGDSAIEQYGPRVAEVLAKNSGFTRGAIFLTHGGAIPIDHIRRIDGNLTSIDNFLRVAANKSIDRVVIGAAWSLYFNHDKSDLGLTGELIPRYFIDDISLEDPQGRQLAGSRLESMVRQLISQGKVVYLLSGTPGGKEFGRAGMAPARGLILDDIAASNDYSVPREQVAKRLAMTTELLSNIASRTNAVLINPLDHLCDAIQCPTAAFKDIGHLRASFVRYQLKYLDVTVSE